MGHSIGIDLGTTNSCVAFMDGKKPVVIPNKSGYRTTPSTVSFEKDRILVGQLAQRQSVTNPANTIFNAKRLIGRNMSSKEVEIARAMYPYNIVEGDQGQVQLEVSGDKISLEQISALILSEMKKVAEEFIGEEVSHAVVTVPAYFNDLQRQATKDAGEIAGLNVMRIINEPTAAAIAYGFNKKNNKLVGVYDLGGGTFDFSLLEIVDGIFKVVATSGDTFLGGEDIDYKLAELVIEKFQTEKEIDLSKSKLNLQRIREVCEFAKRDLSQYMEVEINLPFLEIDSEHSSESLMTQLSRKELEEIAKPLVERSIEICGECLENAGVSKEDLDDVVLVGGQTRMPGLVDMMSNFFGRSVSRQINPDEAVAMGAAIHAYSLQNQKKRTLCC